MRVDSPSAEVFACATVSRPMHWTAFIGYWYCLVLGLALPTVAHGQLAGTDLDALLSEDGFDPPPRFKAVVGRVIVDDRGQASTEWFDWRGTADDREDWWPASSIKLYAAVAALVRSRELGFGTESRLTFFDEDRPPFRMRLCDIVRRAIVDSSNPAFNRLVEFVGFDALHERFFTQRNGLEGTVFLRSYGGQRVDPQTGHGLNRWSPRIAVLEGHRRRVIPARQGQHHYRCPNQGNCTTLRQLAESIRRVVLHDRLSADQRFALGEEEIELLRDVLAAPRRRHGMLLVEALQRGLGPHVRLRVYHKPGFAYRWSSDVMFVHRLDTGEQWVLAAAAWPGRRILDEALFHLGRVFASGRLGDVGS